MSEQVTVEVTITERVTYTARVKMPREKFEAMDKGLSLKDRSERRRAEETVGDLCDRQSDWLDADDLEIESFGIVADDEA
jgi:hypothetical protein